MNHMPISMHRASDVITHAEKPVEDVCTGLLPMENCDETTILNSSVSDQSQLDDASTPPLRMLDDEEDDDDDVLSDCMGSLTCHETDEMLQGFELYVQHYHECDSCNPTIADPPTVIVTDDSRSTGYVPSLPASTPELESWPSTWMEEQSSTSSVDGIYHAYGFEPDVYTLDGLRRDLFAAYE